ncbi:MAG: PQQ-binding-like beta-propeller repeat protein [Planctomycetes bacterium]|nr:PQQ-binding-like beta-propeller repeat protein [Planctomycetota bacterium]
MVVLLLSLTPVRGQEAQGLPDFLGKDDVRGGLCVQIGGEAALACQLHLNGKFLVHGLLADAKAVSDARTTIQSRRLAGKVSVDVAGTSGLPYSDNIINALVVPDAPQAIQRGLTVAEMARCVAPYGVLLLGGVKDASLKDELSKAGMEKVETVAGGWLKATKNYPKDMDEWPQNMHDAAHTDVSLDRQAGPLETVRWIAGEPFAPRYQQPNQILAGGRTFLCNNDRSHKGSVECRDAFNGLLLWKSAQDAGVGAMASDGRKLFMLRGQLEAWDAATGKSLFKCDNPPATWSTLQMQDGVVILCSGLGQWARAFDAETGKLLWQTEGLVKRHGCNFCVIGGGQAYFLCQAEGGGAAKAGDAKAPNEKYRIRGFDLKTGKKGIDVLFEKDATEASLQQYLDGKLVLASKIDKPRNARDAHVLSAADGRHLWTARTSSQSVSGGGLFLLDGIFWAVNNTGSSDSNSLTGYDGQTGQVKNKVDKLNLLGVCDPMIATTRYLIGGRMHLYDLQSKTLVKYAAARVACRMGPRCGNGLIYLTRNFCPCGDGLRGNMAFAPTFTPPAEIAAAQRLEKGPAYGQPDAAEPEGTDDWPTYRHDAGRGGVSKCEIPADLKVQWRAGFDGPVSAPVFAGGRVYVSVIDEHRVVALNAADGKQQWSFTAGGRVDSPPTIYKGLVLFGCCDGWTYCLRVGDGSLVWRFQAAPADRRIVVREQLESVWPVFGSVLAEQDNVYFAAGRHADIDGGIHFFALKPQTGEIVWKQVLKNLDHNNEFAIGIGIKGEAASNDILRSDGRHVYLCGTNEKVGFDLQTGQPLKKDALPRPPRGNANSVSPSTKPQSANPVFSTVCGMLLPAYDRAQTGGDKSTESLAVWIYNPDARFSGYGFGVEWFKKADTMGYAGDMLVFDGPRVFGAGREQDRPARVKFNIFGKPSPDAAAWFMDPGETPQRLASMAVAGKTLIVAFGGASPPAGKKDASTTAPSTSPAPAAPPHLLLLSTEKGEKLADLPLPSVPYWNGLAVAADRLFVTTQDGELLCLGKKK